MPKPNKNKQRNGGKSRKRQSEHQKQLNARTQNEKILSQHTDSFLSSLPADSVPNPIKCRSIHSSDVSKSAEKLKVPNDLVFEDPFEDEFMEEIICPEEEDTNMDEDEEESAPAEKPVVWHPSSAADSDVKLEYDSSAYLVYHKLNVEWPCLSFDVVRDNLGDFRSAFPMTMTLVSGSQARDSASNKVSLWHITDLHKTKYDTNDSDDEGDVDMDGDEGDDGLDTDPIIDECSFKHTGGVNRIRSAPQASNIIATWADTGRVHIYDCKDILSSMMTPGSGSRGSLKPVFTYTGHRDEGFAMDWSPLVGGRLATGDCMRNICVWDVQGTSWSVSDFYKGHTASVEDLQWSPTEKDVFASCSVDRSVKFWDVRVQRSAMLSIDEAHTADVNVISWNKKAPHLLASGGDDGHFKIWDLRMLRGDNSATNNASAVGNFNWHKQPITSIQWHPTQESVLTCSSEDDSVTVWDMSLEDDPDVQAEGARLGDVEVPAQLLFVHRGQKHIKEVGFHPQIPSMMVSTAADGFNLFRPDNL